MASAQGELLEGEDPLSRDPDDARHWFNVYTELVSLVDSVVRQAEHQSADVTTDHVAEVIYVRARLDTLRGRLEFWRQRLAGREAPSADPYVRAREPGP